MPNALTIHELDREKVDLIKQTVAKGATDLELELFLHACQRTGLDPLMKQIYAIKRWSQADGREVMSFQTGIDGLRLIADRTGKYAGSSDAIFEEKDGKPILAQVTVLKIIEGEKCAFTASARYEEYVQKNRQMQPTSMWAKMPYLMLAKCAEAQALRKAFPMELSGLYTNEEMSHLDCDWKESLQRTPSQIMADIEQRDKGQDGPDETAKAAIPVVPVSRDAAPQHKENDGTETLFTDSQALVDYETKLMDAKGKPADLQAVWDEIVKDASLKQPERARLYQIYRKVGKKK